MHKRKIFSLVRKLPRNETTKSCGKGKNRESPIYKCTESIDTTERGN